MPEALIIDACRTPRGIGKVGKGALADIHPQQLAASVLGAMADWTASENLLINLLAVLLAMLVAPSAPARWRAITANSSPPSRASRSPSRIAAERR